MTAELVSSGRINDARNIMAVILAQGWGTFDPVPCRLPLQAACEALASTVMRTHLQALIPL
jgi:hypothetical protein